MSKITEFNTGKVVVEIEPEKLLTLPAVVLNKEGTPILAGYDFAILISSLAKVMVEMKAPKMLPQISNAGVGARIEFTGGNFVVTYQGLEAFNERSKGAPG
jgi:hypothetical protein